MKLSDCAVSPCAVDIGDVGGLTSVKDIAEYAKRKAADDLELVGTTTSQTARQIASGMHNTQRLSATRFSNKTMSKPPQSLWWDVIICWALIYTKY